MIGDAVRVVAAWLTSSSAAVSTILATVPVDNGDTRPAAPDIYDETTVGWLAQDRVPETIALTKAALCVMAGADVPVTRPAVKNSGGGFDHELDVTVAVAICARNALTQNGLVDIYRIQRAVVDSLASLGENVAAPSNTRNGVVLEQLVSLTISRTQEAIGDLPILAGVMATFKVRAAASILAP